MRHGFTVGLLGPLVLLLATGGTASAQSPTVSRPSSSALSPALSELPIDHWVQTAQGVKLAPSAKSLRPRGAGPGGPNIGGATPPGDAGAHPRIETTAKFGGIGASGYIPPDPNIAVGKSNSLGVGYIVQAVNSQMAVFDKSGNLVTGPVSLSSLWSTLPGGGGCATNNAGDPVVQYDAIADRWLISQLGSTSGPTYSECIGVSQTNNPSGTYFLYSYSFGGNLNDYPKFGVWPTATNSAYLASYNLFSNGQSFIGSALCAYDRDAMRSGAASPTQICFTVSGDGGFLPSDLDGATPPSDGTPGYFVNFETLSSLRVYQMSQLNFAAGTATLTGVVPDISVAPFSDACGGGTCIAQPNNQKLDSLGDRLMYRLAYRVFNKADSSFDHASMVVNHSITAGSSVGVRWYELRQPAAGGAFSLFQQGTFAPDSAYRWMGSAAMDGAGNIALGYSKSSGSIYPSIAFTSRTPDMPAGTMGAESILRAGAGAQTTYSRWGDYTSLRIDPDDDKTFWYTNEYYTHGGLFNFTWSTAIGAFTVAGGGGGSPPPDFGLSVSPTALTVTRGSDGTATVTITASNGSNAVALTASGLPKATSASFNPSTVTTSATGTSILTIKVNRSAPKGTSNLTISGTNGTMVHSAALMLTIQ